MEDVIPPETKSLFESAASGELDFLSSLSINSGKGKSMGYAVSHTVTDPQSVEVGHALTFGPDRDIFVPAMRKAAPPQFGGRT